MSEVWRQILNSRFQVSNRGNVRYINANGDLVMRQCDKRLSFGTNRYPTIYFCGKLHKLHRVVMAYHGPPQPSPEMKYIDHIDGNGSNNDVTNLRWCTASQNQANRLCDPHKPNSRFKGVYLHKGGKWFVMCGKRYHGFFEDERAAAARYNDVAREMYGQFARLNAL